MIVGGLLYRLGSKLVSTSGRLEERLAPVCWRCHEPLWPGDMNLVPGDDFEHRLVWACRGCVSDRDRDAVREFVGE